LNLKFKFEEKDFNLDFEFEEHSEGDIRVVLSKKLEEVKFDKKISILVLNIPAFKD